MKTVSVTVRHIYAALVIMPVRAHFLALIAHTPVVIAQTTTRQDISGKFHGLEDSASHFRQLKDRRWRERLSDRRRRIYPLQKKMNRQEYTRFY